MAAILDGLFDTDVARTVKRKVGQTASTVGTTLQDAGATNIGGQLEKYGTDLARKNASAVPTIADINGARAAGTFAGETVVEGGVDAAKATTSGIAANLATKAGLALLQRAPLGRLASAVARAAPAIQKIGTMAGVLAPTAAEEYGGIRQEQRETGVDDKGRAALAAIPATALEALGVDKKITKAIGGTEKLAAGASRFKHAAREAGVQALTEGATEVAQTGIERAGAGKEVLADANEYLTAGAKGAGGGAVVGGTLAAATPREQPAAVVDPNAGPLSRAAAQAPGVVSKPEEPVFMGVDSPTIGLAPEQPQPANQLNEPAAIVRSAEEVGLPQRSRLDEIIDTRPPAPQPPAGAQVDPDDAPNFGLPEAPRTIPNDDPIWQAIPGQETINIKSPERDVIREGIVAQHFRDAKPAPPDRKPIAYVMGGGGASGKGTLLATLQEQGIIPHDAVHIDPDMIKSGDEESGFIGIPEYKAMLDRGDSRAAAVVHEESSQLAKQVMQRAIQGRNDMVLDRTMSSPEKSLAEIKSLKDAGYDVRLFGLTVDPANAVRRAVTRANRSGRFVPLNLLLKAHKGFTQGFESYAQLADEAYLFDNDVPQGTLPPIIASRNGEEPLAVLDAVRYNTFGTRKSINEEARTVREIAAGVGAAAPAGGNAAAIAGAAEAGREDGAVAQGSPAEVAGGVPAERLIKPEPLPDGSFSITGDTNKLLAQLRGANIFALPGKGGVRLNAANAQRAADLLNRKVNEIIGMSRESPQAKAATGFGVVVSSKPGTKVQADGEVRQYDRARDGGNLPPIAAPVQRDPDLGRLHKATENLLRSPRAQRAMRKHFGVKGLKFKPLRGSYEGTPETSFMVTGEGLSEENAAALASFLGLAFGQDAVIVSKPTPPVATQDSIPTIEMYNEGSAKLSSDQWSKIVAEMSAAGVDYSETTDGKGVRVLHFGDEAGFRSLLEQMSAIAQRNGLAVGVLHTRSELHEAGSYLENLRGAGREGVPGDGPEVFGALVDDLLVPFTRAIGREGYRFDADRFAARYGIDEQQLGKLKQSIAGALAPRSTVPLLRGEEKPEVTATGGRGKTTIGDAAWFLQNRAASLGTIDPNDRSQQARNTIADTLADEVVFQLEKPAGKQALGWYDRQLKAAAKEIARIFPEIETDPKAGFIFRALLAVTSQGLTVPQNFDTAIRAYSKWKRTGKVTSEGFVIPGASAPLIRGNIDKIASMIEERGVEGAEKFFTSMHKVRELKKAGIDIKDRRLDDEVRGWMAFGPKIGSFANNLYGDFDTLTADLWFTRTWNRVLGTMFKYSPEAEANQIKSFREELQKALQDGSSKVLNDLDPELRARVGEFEADFEIARKLERAFAMSGYKERTPLNRRAKAWVENVEDLQETPRGPVERRWQDEVIREVQKRVEARTGNKVTIADLQALLWYQEKELFRLLGAASKDSAPLDYNDSAKAAVERFQSGSFVGVDKMEFTSPIKGRREYSDLDGDEKSVIKRTVRSLVKDGMPQAWVDRVKSFFSHSTTESFSGRFYMNGAATGSISVRFDKFEDAKEMRRVLAHEIAHAADFDAETGGFASASSPLFNVEDVASTSKPGWTSAGGERVRRYSGAIIRELHDAYTGGSPLADELAYPFGRDYSAEVTRVEAFAQGAMLYFTNRDALRKHAPMMFKLMEGITRNEAAAESRGPVQRASEAVRRALRSGAVRRSSLLAAVERRDPADGEVAEGRGDGPEAGRSEPRPRREGVKPKPGEPFIVYRVGRGRGLQNANAGNALGVADFLARAADPDSSVGAVADDAVVTAYRVTATDELGPYQTFRNGYHDSPADRVGYRDVNGAQAFSFGSGGYTAERIAEVPLRDIQARLREQGYETFDDAGALVGASVIEDVLADPVGMNMMPSPSTSFEGFTLPSAKLSRHLANSANGRLNAYKSAAAQGGENLRTLFQDYFLPVRRVQEAIEAAGGTISEEQDVYGREELYYGRTGEQLRKLEEEHVKPLVKALVDSGVEQDDLELYLYAKFAPARNARIAAINPRFPDGGSGMTNADAAQVLADFDAAGLTQKLEALRDRVKAMNKVRLDTLENAGLLSPDEAKLWREDVDYVPLKGFAESNTDDDEPARPRTGSGFSVGGREAFRALGRKSRATDIIANSIAQTEQAIIRAEKNRVARALFNLVEANPNESLWAIDATESKPALDPSTGEVVYKQVAEPDAVLVKIDGKEHRINLRDKRLIEAMKNMGSAKVGAILRGFSSINRFLSLTRTMLAPEFVIANFARDIQTAAVNLTGEQGVTIAAKTVRDVPKAMGAMYARARGKSQGGEWARWADEFADEGAVTSFVNQRTVEEQQSKIESLLNEAKGGGAAAARKVVRNVFEWIGDANSAVENATRLAAYANARRSGMSKQQAARIAKNLTVNFNRKGSVGPALNALYLFYNASIQGMHRFLRAMKSPAVQKIMGATAAMGFGMAFLNRALMGEDDDGEDKWDKIPEYEKSRNLILAVGDGYVKIPLPYTYNVPYMIGQEVADTVFGQKKASTGAANVVNTIIGAFNPLGDLDVKRDAAETTLKLLTPTALSPAADIALNKNFFGGPIMPAANPFDRTPQPDSERAFASTNPGLVWLARALNSASGGNSVKPGAIDISPASMEYVFDYLTGGTGSFVERSVTAAMLAAKGEDVPANKIPFARVVFGEHSPRRATDTYYRVRDDVLLRFEQAKLAAETKGDGFSKSELREFQLGRQLAPALRNTESLLRKLRDARKAAQARGDDQLVKDIDAKMIVVQTRFNRLYFARLEQ